MNNSTMIFDGYNTEQAKAYAAELRKKTGPTTSRTQTLVSNQKKREVTATVWPEYRVGLHSDDESLVLSANSEEDAEVIKEKLKDFTSDVQRPLRLVVRSTVFSQPPKLGPERHRLIDEISVEVVVEGETVLPGPESGVDISLEFESAYDKGLLDVQSEKILSGS